MVEVNIYVRDLILKVRGRESIILVRSSEICLDLSRM
jgi:hypothetical protein